MLYAIQMRDRQNRTTLLNPRYASLEGCHEQIRRYAVAWHQEAIQIMHRPGESVVLFPDGTCLEYWRAGQSEVPENNV